MQTRFRKDNELKQLEVLGGFQTRYGRKPNLDDKKDLRILLSGLKLTKIK